MRLHCRISSRLRAILPAFLLIAASSSAPAFAQSAMEIPEAWTNAVHALANKIAAAAGETQSISLDARSISSLGPSDVSLARQALESDLTQRHFRIVSAPSAASAAPSEASVQVRVTFSEGIEGLVWVAEIRPANAPDNTPQVAIVSAPKSTSDKVSDPKISLTLSKKLVWDQPERFLDFATINLDSSKSALLVLGLEKLFVYKLNGAIQESQESAPISRFYPSRDLRGEITSVDATRVRAYIDGVVCAGNWNATLEVTCDENGPLVAGEHSFMAHRNYFGSTLTMWSGPLAVSPSFYSTAYPPDASEGLGLSSAMILAELDGMARLYEKRTPPDSIPPIGGDITVNHSLHPSAVFSGWGDDIVSIAAGCEGAWYVLVAGTGDWLQPDYLQAYAISGSEAVATGQSLQFPGPIFALWPADGGKSVRVVSRNLRTGLYEASIVSASCGN
jgi:hypothetical protein